MPLGGYLDQIIGNLENQIIQLQSENKRLTQELQIERNKKETPKAE